MVVRSKVEMVVRITVRSVVRIMVRSVVRLSNQHYLLASHREINRSVSLFLYVMKVLLSCHVHP